MVALPSVLLAAAGLFASPAAAYFRMNCGQVLTTQRADPIVNPGKVSGHLHQIVGGNAFDFNQTYESTRKSTCTTCEASADLSNYWTPTLWYQAQNGSVHRVNQLGGAAVYYIQRTGYVWSPTPPPEPPKVKAFPAGFRMLAGDPFLRSFDENSKEQKAIKHTCLDYSGEATHHQELPAKPCPNGVRTEVLFPSCWDGVNLDSDNHKSHMAYPDQVEDGNCPDTHPVRLVTILVEVIWDTMAFKDMWWTPPGATQPFVLSNGDPTGYGHHGDFLNGWDVDVLQEALDSCNSDTGLMTDCPVLQLRSADDMFDCTVPPRVPESAGAQGEWLEKLPGCITVQAGPDRASPPSECSDTTDILPPQSYLTPVPGWTALGCARDAWEARVLGEDHYSPGGMTPALCAAHCTERGFAYAGVAFGNECSCGSSVDAGRIAGEGGCNQRCEGDASQWCGGGLRMAVYQNGGDNPASSEPETPEPQPEPKPEPQPEPEPEPILTASQSEPTSTEAEAPSWTEPPVTETSTEQPSEAPSSTVIPEPTEEPSTPTVTSDIPESTETEVDDCSDDEDDGEEGEESPSPPTATSDAPEPTGTDPAEDDCSADDDGDEEDDDGECTDDEPETTAPAAPKETSAVLRRYAGHVSLRDLKSSKPHGGHISLRDLRHQRQQHARRNVYRSVRWL